MALPKHERLKTAKEFREVFGNHKGAKAKNLLLKAKPTQNSLSRFSAVISKRVSKKAVERNRMRRLLTEAFGELRSSVPDPHDIVLVALPGLSVPDYERAKTLLSELIHQTFSKNT